ncbi:hypothetical protein PHYC_00871 [Phycisphaerales bacterium]|nr:hypothetical protein PHYC_00871 [Phycisphaerales bacterium]
MRVVLDTNVVISGILRGGLPGLILEAWARGGVLLVVSPEVLGEYYATVKALADRCPLNAAERVIDAIAARSEAVDTAPLPAPICRDPDDDKFIACALSGSALLVSGDKDLLAVTGVPQLQVLSPREFVNRYLRRS